MSYDLYWNGDFDCVDSYIAKNNIESKLNQLQTDTNAWLNGVYVTRAIASVFDDRKARYPKEPMYFKSEEIQQETNPISPEEKLARDWQALKSCFAK